MYVIRVNKTRDTSADRVKRRKRESGTAMTEEEFFGCVKCNANVQCKLHTDTHIQTLSN